MKAIKLTTCGSSIEANIIKGRLNNEGIYCFITNEHFTTLMPHYNQIIGGAAQIMVNEKDYEKATEIMNFIC